MLNRQLLLFLAAAPLFCIVVFAVSRQLVIRQAPIVVMSTIEARIAQGAGSWNACFHNRAYGPRANAARRANPDSIISSMAYDLSDGPVRVSGETWHRYWSLSLYQQNSDNFFVVNDQELDRPTFDFVIALSRQDTSALDGVIVESPTEKGIMLIRRFAADPSDMDGILENQDKLTCGPA